MSPKAIQFKANSVIYFQGDMNEKTYILNSGKVILKTVDIESGQEIQDVIQTGEFFGVKSALGKYPREETAIVVLPSNVIEFSVPEFEQIASKNTRIIMKMLKVFSNQLRRIHKQVQNLLSAEEQGKDPEEGLYQIGEYYLGAAKYPQALYAFRRYLTYYPSGRFSDQATPKMAQAEANCQKKGHQGGGIAPAAVTSFDTSTSEGKHLSDVAKKYYNGVSLFSQQKFAEAFKEFKKIIEQSNDEEYKAKSIFEEGRCLFSLGSYDECIKHFTGMIQKYPKHSELLEALFYIGNCYEKKNAKEKAVSFYNKIITMAPKDASVYRKAKKAVSSL
ncbi:MAG: tetratricopeptide repeat protein [Spirochaetales bacterium]|nr:MAG: tetratricopeptide repeat protein [Spirochaetales bacterium]